MFSQLTRMSNKRLGLGLPLPWRAIAIVSRLITDAWRDRDHDQAECVKPRSTLWLDSSQWNLPCSCQQRLDVAERMCRKSPGNDYSLVLLPKPARRSGLVIGGSGAPRLHVKVWVGACMRISVQLVKLQTLSKYDVCASAVEIRIR